MEVVVALGFGEDFLQEVELELGSLYGVAVAAAEEVPALLNFGLEPGFEPVGRAGGTQEVPGGIRQTQGGVDFGFVGGGGGHGFLAASGR